MRQIRIEPDQNSAKPAFRRDTTTVACYFLLTLLTLFLAMIGPLTPPLMAELHLGFAQASYHSVALASGMMLTGSVGERLASSLGRGGCVRLSFVIMSLGLTLLCLAPHVAASLSGAFLIGCGGSLTLMVAPATMAARHGEQVGLAYGEANVVAYLGIIAAPAVVGATLALDFWRITFLVPLLACLAFLVFFRRAEFGNPASAGTKQEISELGFGYWCFWGLLMTSVSAENTLLVWAASYYEKQLLFSPSAALWSSMVFPAGIITARIVGIRLVRLWQASRLALPSLALAMFGYMIFSLASHPVAGFVGMFTMGLGMGNLYPFGITLAMSAAQGNRDTATARVAMASAFSMLSAPFIVGAIADRADLATAFAVVPIYLVLAAVVTAVGLSQRRQG